MKEKNVGTHYAAESRYGGGRRGVGHLQAEEVGERLARYWDAQDPGLRYARNVTKVRYKERKDDPIPEKNVCVTRGMSQKYVTKSGKMTPYLKKGLRYTRNDTKVCNKERKDDTIPKKKVCITRGMSQKYVTKSGKMTPYLKKGLRYARNVTKVHNKEQKNDTIPKKRFALREECHKSTLQRAERCPHT